MTEGGGGGGSFDGDKDQWIIRKLYNEIKFGYYLSFVIFYLNFINGGNVYDNLILKSWCIFMRFAY